MGNRLGPKLQAGRGGECCFSSCCLCLLGVFREQIRYTIPQAEELARGSWNLAKDLGLACEICHSNLRVSAEKKSFTAHLITRPYCETV